MNDVCTWQKHEIYPDVWVSSCGHTVESIRGRTPKECGTKNCVWCGFPIKEDEHGFIKSNTD